MEAPLVENRDVIVSSPIITNDVTATTEEVSDVMDDIAQEDADVNDDVISSQNSCGYTTNSIINIFCNQPDVIDKDLLMNSQLSCESLCRF